VLHRGRLRPRAGPVGGARIGAREPGPAHRRLLRRARGPRRLCGRTSSRRYRATARP
jgi:hypothetical protein